MNEEHYDQIERYVLDLMPDQEKLEFEVSLTRDEQLRQDMEDVRLLIRAAESKSMANELDAMHEELFGENEQEQRTFRIWPYVSAIAAGIALILVVRFFIIPTTTSSEDLYASYFEPFPNYITLRQSDQTAAWKDGFTAYDENRFSDAIRILSSAEVPPETRQDADFYIAIAHLSQHQSKEAIAIFTSKLSGNEKYREQINWYLALAYLKEGLTDKAISYFSRIAPGEYNHEEAQSLINQINP
ncbi:MAG: hypothetical protein AAFX87_21105 [Bacteroidota bacterium]